MDVKFNMKGMIYGIFLIIFILAGFIILPKMFHEDVKAVDYIVVQRDSIPDKILNKIFDSGFTTKENKESNNGFGLAIVKELVESYNGKIQVSSTDEFTEFTIYLPTIK